MNKSEKKYHNTAFKMHKALLKLWIPSCESRGITDNTLITYMSKFYLHSMTASANEWINNDCEDDILFVCEVIILCARPLGEE